MKGSRKVKNINVHIKVMVSLSESGLAAKLSHRQFKVLVVLATFMNAKRECFPSQQLLAERSGMGRTQLNETIQELLEFRFNGKPVLEIVGKRRRNNVYRITTEHLAFGKEDEDSRQARANDVLFGNPNNTNEEAEGQCQKSNDELFGNPNNQLCGNPNKYMYGNPNTNYIQYNNIHINNNQEEEYKPSALPTATHSVDNKDNNINKDSNR